MESGLASRTIPMDRHRFSSLYPRPTFWSEHTHIKPRRTKRTKKPEKKLLYSQISCKFLSNCFRSVIFTCVSCIATIKNLITNLEICQKSHPEEFFFRLQHLISYLGTIIFPCVLKVFSYARSRLAVKNASLLVSLWNAILFVFFCVELVNSHPYKHVNFLCMYATNEPYWVLISWAHEILIDRRRR